MRIREYGCLALVAVVCMSTNVEGQQPESQAKVLLKYDEATISDVQRSALAKMLAADLPESEWQTITIQKNDALPTIVDRYYDVYARAGTGKYSIGLPQTTRTLVSLIEEANPENAKKLVAGETLKIPPMPVRTQSGSGASGIVRAFDPASSSYAVVRPGRPVLVRTSTGATPVSQADPIRTAGSTVVEVSVRSIFSNVQFAGDAFQVFDAKLVNVELLQTQNCVPPDTRITQSPYYAAARWRTIAAAQRLDAAAKSRHLALLDFDFQRDHGARVFSAVGWLLDKFGLSALTTYVDQVELNKGVARLELQNTLEAYRLFGLQYNLDPTLLALAALWTLSQQGAEAGQTIYSMPGVLMSAAMWRQLNEGHWLSMSWRIESTTNLEPLRLKETLVANGSFVVVAAGNELAEVRADLFPQGGASIYNEFVNVTFGGPDGALYGSPTSAAGGGKVDLMATGCGITFQHLTASDAGSSYATPIVAAAAWVKSLLDGTPASEMRSKLLHASLLVPPSTSPVVVSGGVFDPARLLAPLTPHYLDPKRAQMFSLDDVTVDAGTCGTFPPIPGQPASQDLIVFQRNGKFMLLRRHNDASFPGVRVEPECELNTLKVTGKGPQGALNIGSPAEFVATIGHLTF